MSTNTSRPKGRIRADNSRCHWFTYYIGVAHTGSCGLALSALFADLILLAGKLGLDLVCCDGLFIHLHERSRSSSSPCAYLLIARLKENDFTLKEIIVML